ncbi:hypothetical protein NEHOM01_0313 [Nematocida homosporus]|uniref:uncharacterized protein n=1 Tax=Nematocida homosporus TaxID=1912981 RepID=UPI00221EC85A|nr:uncharacterized protein NEHOM01_0313 [Nematocida homosporus]KAI5184638.1 hypothetical protein NEHOM01_0313 [Nematocida homosporus]
MGRLLRCLHEMAKLETQEMNWLSQVWWGLELYMGVSNLVLRSYLAGVLYMQRWGLNSQEKVLGWGWMGCIGVLMVGPGLYSMVISGWNLIMTCEADSTSKRVSDMYSLWMVVFIYSMMSIPMVLFRCWIALLLLFGLIAVKESEWMLFIGLLPNLVIKIRGGGVLIRSLWNKRRSNSKTAYGLALANKIIDVCSLGMCLDLLVHEMPWKFGRS